MTKDYNPKRETHSNKDLPGCMGGILHLFDFHHPHNGRKLLSDKRHLDGLEAPRNSLDVSSDTPHTSEIKNEDIPYAYEMKKVPSARRKTSGMPIKTLIAQEMSKETESKRRTPSVVARLMGLDAMPTESVSAHNIKAAEIHPQKKMSRKQQQQPKSPRNVHFFHKKSKAPTCKPPSEPNTYQEAIDHSHQKASSGTHPFQDHPQEQQLQEFKKQFAAWQASKVQDRSKPLQPDKLNIQLSDKQTLVHEKLNEAKMALVREKFVDAKRLATDEKLQQSKEFLDALEVLQSNKELFLKFLQEPNSLFAKHTQDIQSTSGTLEKQLPKTKSSSPVKRHEMWKEKDHSHVKCFKEENTNESRLQRQNGHKFLTEREDAQQFRVLSPDKSMPVCSMHEQNKHYPSICSDGKNNSSLPTRIVVLKPGPGRPQNYRPSPSPSCSPHSQTGLSNSGEREKGANQDFLREVRERLKMSFDEKKKYEYRTTERGLQDKLNNRHKDPRHIARQIARQVRESVTRDLAYDSSRMEDISTLSGFSRKKNYSSRSTNSFRDVDIGNQTEIFMSGTNYSCDYTSRSNQPVSSSFNKPSDLPKYEKNEPRKSMSGSRRTTQWEEEEQQLRKQQLRQISNTLGQMLAFPGNKKHVPESNNYHQNNRGTTDDDETNVLCCDMHESDNKGKRSIKQEMNAEQEVALGNENYEDTLPTSLLRSQSILPSATTIGRVSGEKQRNASCANNCNGDEIGLDGSGDSIPTELVKSKIERSGFKGKVSNLKDSLLRGRRSSSKKLHCAHTVQPNNYDEIHFDDRCDLHHEVPSSSNRLEKSNDLHVLSLQEKCMQSVDCHCPDVSTELVKSPPCSIHRASPIDDKGSEECLVEESNLVPALAKHKAKLSGVDTDCVIEEILPEEDLEKIPSCGPMKEPLLDETSASENNDKGERPSPVSVLELPFQEESPSLKGFEEISTNLQDLRLQLRLLKFDGFEKLQHESENLLPGETTVFEDHHDIEAVCIESENTCTSPSEGETSPAARFPCLENYDVDIGSMMLIHVSCPETNHADLLYLRDALVASGFTGNADAIFAQWHSPSHPVDPCLYEKLQDNELTKVDSVCEGDAYRSKSEQHALFDCINEVLLEILGPFFNSCPWVKPTKRKLLRHIPVGNQLLEETWRKLSYYLYTQSDMEYTLDNLVAKDMDRDGVWLELQDDVEMVGIEVDKMIFDDLIEEVSFDLLHG